MHIINIHLGNFEMENLNRYVESVAGLYATCYHNWNGLGYLSSTTDSFELEIVGARRRCTL